MILIDVYIVSFMVEKGFIVCAYVDDKLILGTSLDIVRLLKDF